MNRRDFLSLRMTRQGRVLELSCRGLFMQYLDADAGGSAARDAALDHEPWMGEPPAVLERPTAEVLLARVAEDLARVERLRLVDSEWLDSTALGPRLAPLLASFQSRGGRVERAGPND
jgi:hypothetical protein